jgi:hypothetical protein
MVVFDSFKNCSLSLIFKVTLRSGTIVVSPFKTFMKFSGIAFFYLLKTRIFCNSSITYKNKPLAFTSFLQSNLRTINDIWDSNNTNFKSCHDTSNFDHDWIHIL